MVESLNLGFRLRNVGLFVGFSSLPDTYRLIEISNLNHKCRVCRVFIGVESSQEIMRQSSVNLRERPHSSLALRRGPASEAGLQLDSKCRPGGAGCL
jgi:hypothetical protein